MTEVTLEEKKETSIAEDGYVSDDPIILEAFNDIKTAILAKRTDIVRQILSAAQSLREEDEYDSDGEEKDKKEVGDKYDRGEYLDLLSLLLLHKDTDSGTLLHYATRIDSPDIVRTILSAGANCTIRNTENMNAFAYCQSDQMKNVFIGELMQAVSQSRVYRVEQLILAGIDINSCDGASSNNSVLHWAVSFSDLATVKFVLEKSVEINARNAKGETPLHDAVKRGDKEIIIELLKHGASINTLPIKGINEGKSPYMLTSNKPEIRRILEEFTQELVESKTQESLDNSNAGLTNGDASLIEKVSISKRPINLIKPVEVDRSLNFLCPPPRMMRQFDGLYLVPPTELSLVLKIEEDLLLQTKEIIDLFSLKLQDLGVSLSIIFNDNASLTGTYMQCIINKHGLRHRDEYKLQFSTNKIVLLSSGLPSLYYGMATFLQILKIYKGKAIPLVQISDWPIHKKRGVLFDFQENDAPTIKQMCELVDLLSLFKINQIQMNVEHIDSNSQRFFYDAKDFCELQLFCKRRFIRISPYVKIAPTSSLIKISNGREEIVYNKLELLLSSFVFPRTLHVSIQDAEHVYQDISRFCSKKKLHLQLTTEKQLDMHLDQMVDLMNDFSFSINCSNLSSLKDRIEYSTNLGLPYDLCIDDVILNDRICPNHIDSINNVHKIATCSPKHGCHSFIVTYGKKARHLNNLSLMLPGLLITLSMGWNIFREMNEDLIKEITNMVVYEDDNDVIASRVLELGSSIPGFNATMIDDIIQKCSTDKDSLSNEELHDFSRHVKMLKTDLEKMKLKLSLNQFVYDELAMLTEIFFFIARLCYGILNNQISPSEIKNLSQVNKSDYSNRLMSLLKQYESLVNTYYKHPPNTKFVSLQLLQNILKDILPTNVPSTAPNIMGVFTV